MLPLRMDRIIAIAAALGMLMPGHWAAAADLVTHEDTTAAAPTSSAPQPAALPKINDVALSRGEILTGVVVDPTGTPVHSAPVALLQSGRELARTNTDRLGRFAFQGLRGGVYQIVASDSAGVFRVWAAGTSPPAARPLAVLIRNPLIVRGQGPLHDLFFSDAFVLSAVVIGAIVVPFAILNSRDNHKAGS